MHRASVFTGLFLLLVALTDATALDISSLRDPRPTGWSLDHSGQLSQGTRDTLDALGREVKSRTGHELVIVAVASTDGENQRAFATRLFNRWQLGDRTRNDGVLLFVALSDRRVEFVLGDGLDSDAQVAVTQHIIDQDILPRFRAGDPQAAVLAGARTCARRILGLTLTANNNVPMRTLRITGDTVQVDDQLVERDTTRPTAPVTPRTAHPATGYSSGYSSAGSSDSTWQLWGLAGSGGGGIAGFFFWRRWLRNRPRTCTSCQQPMVRLGEHEDDQHLDHGEKIEERVGSVDYDLWVCTACPQVLKLRYGTWFTSYARCPRCHAVTKSSNETTLIAATYDHGGQVRVNEACVACDYRNTYTRSTPQKTRPQNSNRSSFGGSGGNSGGGGRSSGRGGGGGW
jgi:uncharacterized protein